MKATLFVLFLVCASAAFGQSTGAAVLNNEPVVIRIPSHPAHASQNLLAREESVLFTSSNTSAHGERPLWEVAKPAAEVEVPLGDVARMLREQHATVKKAVKVLEK